MAGDTVPHRTGATSRPRARPGDAWRPIEAVARILSAWIERARQRRCLAGLSGRSLKDMGISRDDALQELRKRFWRR